MKNLLLIFAPIFLLNLVSCTKDKPVAEETVPPAYNYNIKILDDFDSTGISDIKIELKEPTDDPYGPLFYYVQAGCTDANGEWMNSYNSSKWIQYFNECNAPAGLRTAKHGEGDIKVREVSDNFYLPHTGQSGEIRTSKETIYVKQYAFLDLTFDRVNQYNSDDSLQISVHDVDYVLNCNDPKGQPNDNLELILSVKNKLYWRQYHVIKWKTKYNSSFNIDSVYVDDIYEQKYIITY